jgi:hypothetical protein
MGRKLVAIGMIALGAYANAQIPGLTGPGRFPQFRDMAGLSGNGFGVTKRGDPSILGVVSLSIPSGNVLGNGWRMATLASRSQNSSFQWVNTGKSQTSAQSDGTFAGVFGFSTNFGNIALSHMILSSQLDSVQHVHWQLPIVSDNYSVSVGVHNITARPHAAGDSFPADDSKNSRSYFVAGTYQTEEGHALTLGKGDTRFKGLFGGMNMPLGEKSKFFAEFDTFNWNYGLAHEVQIGENGRMFLTAGMVRGKFATWTVSVSF